MIGEYYYGTGRRKSSVARVFMKAGSGKIIVNGKPVETDTKLDSLAAADSIRTDAEMHLGRRDDTLPMRETRFQDVRFYRRALPPTEVARLPYEDIAAEIVARQSDPKKFTTDEAFIAALEEGALDNLAITPSFFGMLGGQGALPLRYTEIVAERESVWRDRAARAFFDIFSNRATALFYLAWKKYRLPLQYEVDNSKHYLPLLLSLAGAADKTLRRDLTGTPGAIERIRINPETLEPRYKVIGVDKWSDEEGFEEAIATTGVTGICGSGIIEAIAERIDWKHDLYRKIAPFVAEHAILASNTSGFDPAALAEGLVHPERVVVAKSR